MNLIHFERIIYLKQQCILNSVSIKWAPVNIEYNLVLRHFKSPRNILKHFRLGLQMTFCIGILKNKNENQVPKIKGS